MVGVITGDIIKSQSYKDADVWLNPLKSAFKHMRLPSAQWSIYRGDSFQLVDKDFSKILRHAIYLKACIKTVSDLDVRMGLGVGKQQYQGESVKESNGEAFILSGEAFETLQANKTSLQIKTNNEQLNKELNLYLRLALIAMDNWTANSAEVVKLFLESPGLIQSEMAVKLGVTQNAVSKRMSRAYLKEILQLLEMFETKIYSLTE